jgi:catechol 2,3-dioxygenase-like lactoylglutathione lyase family enzyme
MRPPEFKQQVTFLFCKNLEETTRFYQEILGLDLVLDQGTCRIFQVTEEGFLGFCQRETIPPLKEGVIVTLVTSEVDRWYHYLSENQTQIEKAPQENPHYNIYHMFLRDPDGYLIEIQKFLDPSWPQPNQRTLNDR